MRMEKCEVKKEDGRRLTYYHFPQTATEEQKRAFAEVKAKASEASPPSSSEAKDV